MKLAAHYDFELYQMDVKTIFLNGDQNDEVYMQQFEGFHFSNDENLVYELKRSIYGL